MGRAYGAEPTQTRFDERVARLAASQHGVFSRGQVMRIGSTKGLIQHRLRTRRWELLAGEIFRLGGAPESWHQLLMVATLAWGAGAVISHRAAAALLRLAGFDPGPVELTVPRQRRRTAPGIVHRHPLLRGDVTTAEGFPVTTPARTLIDLAGVVSPEAVEEALDDALRRGFVSIAHMRRRLAAVGRPGRPGVAAMRRLLDTRDESKAVPDSVFERRLQRVLERAGLPPAIPQYPIRSEDRVVAVADYAFPDFRLDIEADSYRWHSGRERWERDRERANDLTLLGWRTIHVTWRALTRRPDSVVAKISAAIALTR